MPDICIQVALKMMMIMTMMMMMFMIMMMTRTTTIIMTIDDDDSRFSSSSGVNSNCLLASTSFDSLSRNDGLVQVVIIVIIDICFFY